ncbi:hypothetical protein BH11PLA1_BH11PLA1_12670 [soil metagenome]
MNPPLNVARVSPHSDRAVSRPAQRRTRAPGTAGAVLALAAFIANAGATPAPTPAAVPATPAGAPTAPSPPAARAALKLDSITPESLLAIVGELPIQRSGYGSPTHRAGLDKARELLLARARALGFEPRLEEVQYSGDTLRKKPAPAAPSVTAPPGEPPPAPGTPGTPAPQPKATPESNDGRTPGPANPALPPSAPERGNDQTTPHPGGPANINPALPNTPNASTPTARPEAQQPEASPPAPVTGIARPAEPQPFGNIIFEIKGTRWPLEVVLVGAHFDAVPAAAGADDNGSGVAALMEIARVLPAGSMERTVRFVLFDLEEARLVGSIQHYTRWKEAQARLPEAQREKIFAMLSLETMGYFDARPASQKNPFKGVKGLPAGDDLAGDFLALTTISRHSALVRAFDEAARGAAPGLKTLVVDQFPFAPPDLLRSDHAPFLIGGVPAIMVTDTANFRNPNYHKATDTIETLNGPEFAKAVRGVCAGVYHLAAQADANAPRSKPEATGSAGAEKGVPAEK